MKQPSSWIAWLKGHPLPLHLLAIAGTILLLAVAAHFVMQAGTRHGARRTVPDFSGIRIDEAQRIARDRNLRLHINDSLFVPAYEGGIVLDQLPEGGAEVKPGRTIYLTINAMREKMVPVPYVAGRSLRQAKNMLEIAGLEIEKLSYRSDIATNYVLEEFCGGKQVTEHTQIEAPVGSGVTLYVGREPDNGRAVVPLLVGYPLRQAKGRLWELGLNVGRINFDEGINLLNQKDARVYVQSPSAERSVDLGTSVDLRLTLDAKKTGEAVAAAERQARNDAAIRMREEQAKADSLAESAFRQAAAPAPEEPARKSNDPDEFFD